MVIARGVRGGDGGGVNDGGGGLRKCSLNWSQTMLDDAQGENIRWDDSRFHDGSGHKKFPW